MTFNLLLYFITPSSILCLAMSSGLGVELPLRGVRISTVDANTKNSIFSGREFKNSYQVN